MQYLVNRAAIAAVWLANGLVCKLLGLLPRHELIVARILGSAHAGLLTKAIGAGEVLLAFWVLSGRRAGWAVNVQIALILTMNVLESFLAPDLLLWGRANLLFALLFSGFIAWNHRLGSRP